MQNIDAARAQFLAHLKSSATLRAFLRSPERQRIVSLLKSSKDFHAFLRSPEFKELYKIIPNLPVEERKSFGAQLNEFKTKIEQHLADSERQNLDAKVTPLDITAPCAVNQPIPDAASRPQGSRHPLMTELDRVVDIYNRMGFDIIESRQIDDNFHMFESLNFPDGHPARDGYDTFRTSEGFIPPAHVSTMQNRILKSGAKKLKSGQPIATVYVGRCFRNEDIDPTHEHTFYQYEGMFVSRDATLGNMLGVLREFFESYYGQKLKIRTQPAHFPFTEPSLELSIEKPAALGGKGDGWLEMLGMGMVHPNVLKMAGIDPNEYQGFAWGGGLERLVLLKYAISDIRYFESGKLQFLQEFI